MEIPPESPPPAYYTLFPSQIDDSLPPPSYSTVNSPTPQTRYDHHCQQRPSLSLSSPQSRSNPPPSTIYPIRTLRDDLVEKFADSSTRRTFSVKVFKILTLQLTVITIIILIFLLPGVQRWVLQNTGLLPSFLAVFSGLLMSAIVVVCGESLRRSWPQNIICMVVLTITRGFLSGYIAVILNNFILLLVFTCTAVAYKILSLFTESSLSLKVLLFTGLGVVSIFFGLSWTWYTIADLFVGFLAALVFLGLLLYEMKLVVTVQHVYDVSPDEYMFAALNFYMFFPFNCLFRRRRRRSSCTEGVYVNYF